MRSRARFRSSGSAPSRFHSSTGSASTRARGGSTGAITYNLHIVLRFELERELLAGRLEVRDLPEAFDERVLGYLGLEVPDARSGVLQDIHWADVTFGYFPTYSLGNVMSVQIWEPVR